MVLWVERAAQERNNGPVPASSKWIAQEMSDGMDEVNREFLVQYNHLVSKLKDIDLFVSIVKQTPDNSLEYEDLLDISPAGLPRSQALLSPNQTIVNLEDVKQEEDKQQSPRVLRNNIDNHHQPNIAQLPSPITIHSTKTGPIEQSTENEITLNKFPDSPSILNPPMQQALDVGLKNVENSKSSSNHQSMLQTFEELRSQKFTTFIAKTITQPETINIPRQSEPQIPIPLEIADEAEANDSIQAIQIAIRKSIAEKRKSTQKRQSASRESINIVHKQLDDNNKVSVIQPSGISNNDHQKSSLVSSRPLLSSSLSYHENQPKSLPPAPASIPTLSNNQQFRISSHYKTPKRKSSMFVGLPSREPIPISSARTNMNRPSHSVKSKQPKLTDKLESASQEDERKLLISNTLSPVKLPRSLKSSHLPPPSISDSKLPTLANYTLSKKPSHTSTKSPQALPHEKETLSKLSPRLTSKSISSFQKDNSRNKETSIRHAKSIPSQSNSSNGSFRPYSANLSAPAKPARNRSRSPERSSPIRKHQNLSHVNDAKSKTRSRSPERSSPVWRSQNAGRSTDVKSRSRTRSPEKHTSHISEPYKSTNEPSPPAILSGIDSSALNGEGFMHDRDMSSTSSSVPKPKIGRTTNQPATKNKFLTTTLNRLSPVKTDDQSSIYGHRIIDSPIKNGSYNKNDLQIKRPLHSDSIPLLKKSIGASIENSMKPKKILLTRRYDPKRHDSSKQESPKDTNNSEVSSKDHSRNPKASEEKEDTRTYRAPTKSPSRQHVQQTKVDLKKTEVPFLTRKSRRAIGNAVPLPDAARGITAGDKRRKLNNVISTTNDSMRDVAARTPNKHGHTTPLKRPKNGDILPDILTDDEDNSTIELKKKRTIKSWAATPELLKYVTNQKNINPTDIFGEVNLQIDDVFESPTSKERGKQSPANSPINPDIMREQREYAIKMGYN